MSAKKVILIDVRILEIIIETGEVMQRYRTSNIIHIAEKVFLSDFSLSNLGMQIFIERVFIPLS